MVLFIIFIKSAKFTNFTDFINHLFLLFYQAFSGHFCRLGNSHNLQDGWSDISQNTVIQSLSLFVGHPNARHRIQRMSRIRSTVGIDSIVGISVIGNNQYIVTIGLSGSHNLFDATVDRCYCLLVAAYTPVCPTISPLAKFRQTKSADLAFNCSTNFSATSGADISGCKS